MEDILDEKTKAEIKAYKEMKAKEVKKLIQTFKCKDGFCIFTPDMVCKKCGEAPKKERLPK